MHLEATETFIRLYKKLPKEIQEQVKKSLTLLVQNPTHPSLRHRKMAEQTSIYELSVSMHYRITYEKSGDTAILRKVGTHDILKQPSSNELLSSFKIGKDFREG